MTRVFWKILVDETNQHKSKVLSREPHLASINNQTLKENTKKISILMTKINYSQWVFISFYTCKKHDEARR